MHNYLLFLYAIHKTPATVRVYGDQPHVKKKIMNLLKQPTDNAHNLDIVFHSSRQWMQHYWKEHYRFDTDVVIICESVDEAALLFKEIGAYGKSSLCQNILLIENIPVNYHEFYRKNILTPISNCTIESIFDCKFEADLKNLETVNETIDRQILKTFVSEKPYIYIGKELDKTQYTKIASLMKFRFKIIECVKDECLHGIVFANDFAEKALIYHLAPYESIQKFLNFDEIHLKIPVY